MLTSFQRLSTNSVHEDERFDLWRNCFVGAYLDRPQSALGGSFEGEFLGGGTAEGMIFHNLKADRLVSHFGRRGSDMVLLGHVRRGAVHVVHDKDRREIIDASTGLVLFDCDRPLSTYSSQHDMCYLALPRSMVLMALGQDPTRDHAPMQYLPLSGFAKVLMAHMDEIARRGDQLEEVEARSAMQAASALAIAALSTTHTQSRIEPDIRDEALYQAALRHIEINAGDPTIDVNRIAGLLNCSRTYLYRVFAERQQAAGSYLREVRLKRAHRMLLAEKNTPVSIVAFRCGYTDLSAFGKAFRKRFGISPSALRHLEQD